MPLIFDTPPDVPFEGGAATAPLDIPPVKQEQDGWCWAACAEMVLAHRNQQVGQCELANLLFERHDCCPAAGETVSPCAERCTTDDVAKLYNKRNVSSTPLGRVAAFIEIEAEIAAGRPVQVGLKVDDAFGHLVIVKWAGLSPAGEETLLINDPIFREVTTTYDAMIRLAVESWIGIAG